MVRNFELLNDKGETFSLMDINNYCYMNEPSGLGYSYNTDYQRLGFSYIENLRTVEQGTIEGTLLFRNYDNYKKLVDYVENSDNLYFEYILPFNNGDKTYYRDVQLNSLEKTEIKPENRLLSSQVSFSCLSLWYEKLEQNFKMQTISGETRWDFNWDAQFTSYTNNRLPYVNKGHIDAPIEVQIYGPVKNPHIKLYIENVLKQDIQITANFEQYESLLYGSKENNFYIYKENTDGTLQSLFTLDNIDFSNDNVLRIPRNKSCEIELTADTDITSAMLKIYTMYKAI